MSYNHQWSVINWFLIARWWITMIQPLITDHQVHRSKHVWWDLFSFENVRVKELLIFSTGGPFLTQYARKAASVVHFLWRKYEFSLGCMKSSHPVPTQLKSRIYHKRTSPVTQNVLVAVFKAKLVVIQVWSRQHELSRPNWPNVRLSDLCVRAL